MRYHDAQTRCRQSYAPPCFSQSFRQLMPPDVIRRSDAPLFLAPYALLFSRYFERFSDSQFIFELSFARDCHLMRH